MYRWKPSKTQARAFAQKMQNDPEFAANYQARQEARAEKNRAGSSYDYAGAGGHYMPTKEQCLFCEQHYKEFKTDEQKNAANLVMAAYRGNQKTHHDNIHIINECIRRNFVLGEI